jgi:hypothetical protein
MHAIRRQVSLASARWMFLRLVAKMPFKLRKHLGVRNFRVCDDVPLPAPAQIRLVRDHDVGSAQG